jgi:hypothetical protein
MLAFAFDTPWLEGGAAAGMTLRRKQAFTMDPAHSSNFVFPLREDGRALPAVAPVMTGEQAVQRRHRANHTEPGAERDVPGCRRAPL